jgi:uncharacterized protein (DUF1015 family)
MLIAPISRALVPVDAQAAARLSAPNRDEFVDCVEADSEVALERAATKHVWRASSPHTRVAKDFLFVHEIADPHRLDVRQIGLGGLVATRDILTDDRPNGSIVRNEGVREKSVEWWARLIERTGAFGCPVKLAVEDVDERFHTVVLAYADARPESYRATDERGCTHRVWLVDDPAAIAALSASLAAEPQAYVADGNHRTAAAAALGLGRFSAVFFPARTLGIAPYNRLVEQPRVPVRELLMWLDRSFRIEALPEADAFQPAVTHEIGLYGDGAWHRLEPREGSFDPASAVESVDADIVQRHVFSDALGIDDPTDERLTFVGGVRDASYLRDRVDSGEFAYAVTLPPVTMTQFIEVCRQRQFMPPKSTWFQPKLRTGLVTTLDA